MLADPRIAELVARCGRRAVKTAVLAAQDRVRNGEIPPEEAVPSALASLPPIHEPVINATGVLLHTNLGRAALSPVAIDAITVAAGPTDVEFDLGSGTRARRGRHALAALTEAVPGAEAAHVVNNNAAALALIATALASDKEILISRGELVEIGDGFRLPELLEASGARLREVGTTNRTHVSDYAAAIGDETAFILKVHPSNFRIEGFTAEATIEELAALGPPVVFDIGSGLLRPESALPKEPDAATALSNGADLVTCSGDKLLGGPQAGIILGRAALVDPVRRHPLARAMRTDKVTFAALTATIRGQEQTPTFRHLRVPVSHLHERAHRIAAALPEIRFEVVESSATVGGGGAPGVRIPSVALALPESFATPLRTGNPPVVGRTEHGRLLLDLRTVDDEHDDAVIHALREVDRCT